MLLPTYSYEDAPRAALFMRHAYASAEANIHFRQKRHCQPDALMRALREAVRAARQSARRRRQEKRSVVPGATLSPLRDAVLPPLIP